MRDVRQAAGPDLALADRDHVVDGVAEERAGGDVALPLVDRVAGPLGRQHHRLRPDRDHDLGSRRHVERGVEREAAVVGLDDVAVAVARLHGAVDEVRRADELGDELVLRVLVDLARLAQLHDLARPHDRDVRRQRQRLDLVVRDVDRGDAQLALQALELEAQRLAQLGVQVGQRLVEQQQRRLDDERAGQGQPLLLTAGELGRLPVGVLQQLHRLEHALHPLVDLALARAAADAGAPAAGRRRCRRRSCAARSRRTGRPCRGRACSRAR